MTTDLNRVFALHGSALGIGGEIVQGRRTFHVDGPTAAVRFGAGRASVEDGPQTFGPVTYRFASAFAEATPAREVRRIGDAALIDREVAVRTEVRGLRIGIPGVGPVLKVERVLGGMVNIGPSRSGAQSSVAIAEITGVTGAEIDGHRLRIRINSDLLESHGEAFSRQRLRGHRALGRRRASLFGSPSRRQPGASPPAARRSAGTDDIDDSSLLTTIVTDITWEGRPHPYAVIDGHSVTVANLGRIFFGELVVTRSGRRLSMIRFDLGSPFTYVGLAAHVESSGEWIERLEGHRSRTRSAARPTHAVPTRGDQERGAHPSPSARRAKGARTAARQPVAAVDDAVQCSVFAPSAVSANSAFLIQAFAHLASQASEAARLARQFDELSSPRGMRTLGRVELETALTFTLRLSAGTCEVATQTLVWRGHSEAVQFEIKAPSRANGDIVGTIIVLRGAMPIGELKFVVHVQGAGRRDRAPARLRRSAMARYRRVFFSYSSEDRKQVLRYARFASALKVDFFQDVLKLEPGQRWERELYREIDRSDLFLLFWSRAAKQSKWVTREWRYALRRRKSNTRGRPSIVPFNCGAPPIPKPPAALRHLHFMDPLVYVEAGVRKETPARRRK